MPDAHEDTVVEFVKRTCGDYKSVRKAWIFGSRASGQGGPRSDYDLGFDWHQQTGENWGEFAELLRERNPTLFTMDIVRLDQAGESLKNKIHLQGRVIYERY